MAEHSPEPGLEVTRDALEDRVLAYFDGYQPYAVVEVATGLGVSTTTARSTLDTLEECGALATKTVGDDVDVWYRPREASEGSAGPTTDVVDRRLDAIVKRMDVPGTSELMRSWRRDAVRVVVEHLRNTTTASADELRDEVYPGNAAGYDDPEEWWSMVRKRLLEIPGVVEAEERLLFDAAALVEGQ